MLRAKSSSLSLFQRALAVLPIPLACAFRPALPVAFAGRPLVPNSSCSTTRFTTASSSTRRTMTTTTTSFESTFWNRETSPKLNFDTSLPIVKQAKIISLTDAADDANAPVNNQDLPEGAELLAVGGCAEDFDIAALKEAGANVIFVSHPQSREPLAKLLEEIPTITWVHARSAGIDFITSPTLSNWKGGPVTNAKGQFSSTLAEYSLMACAFFAKDLPLLLRNKKAKNWDKYDVLELRGATMGIIGLGDIGKACARLAKAYGMKVIGLKRRPAPDSLCEVVVGNDGLNRIFAESDYIVCAAPLTDDTKGMIGKEQFDAAKAGAVFINVGRGPIVDEEEMIAALQDGRLKGVGLDVFATEPLPEDSPLWEMDNVLLSPHNMDKTATFMLEASEFFQEENLPRFVRGLPVLNQVDPSAGY